MKIQVPATIKILAPILFGVLLVWYSLSKISFETISEHFKNAELSWICVGVLCGILSHLSRAYRWRFLLEPMGYRFGFANSVMAVFSSYLINYTIPRAGEIARASTLSNYENIPFEKSLGTIITERIVDLVMVGGVICWALVIEFDFLSNLLLERISQYGILSFLVLGLVLLIVYGLFHYLKKRFNHKLSKMLGGFKEGVLSIFRSKKRGAFLAHSILIWALYILMFYTTSRAMSAFDHLPFGAILLAFIVGSFSIATTNAGVGAYPIAVYAALSLYGISEEVGLAFGWILWSSQTIMTITIGGLSLILLPILHKIKKNKST